MDCDTQSNKLFLRGVKMESCSRCGTLNKDNSVYCQECGEKLDQFFQSKYDVFISYSIKDKNIADAVCNSLENNKIRCWIAPRDIKPGNDWGASIIESIKNSSIMILVFSSESNNSPQVVREVERAVNRGLPIIPFRIEDIKPSKSMEYFISSTHWLDALTPPIESHIQKLTKTIIDLLTSMEKSESRDPNVTNANIDYNKENYEIVHQDKNKTLNIITRVLGFIFAIYSYTSLQHFNTVYGNMGMLVVILLILSGSFLVLLVMLPDYFYKKLISKIGPVVGYNSLIFLLIFAIIVLMITLASFLPITQTIQIT